MADLLGYRNWAVTSSGDIVASSAIEVRIKSSGGLATLFEDAGSVTPLANPFTAETDGSFAFFAEANLYDLIVGSGPSQETVPLNLRPESLDLSFTPVLADAASGGNEATAGTATARFVQNGKICLLKVRFVNIDKTGLVGTNDIFITGIPLLAAGTSARSFGAVRSDVVTFAGTLLCEILSATDYVKLWDNQTGGPSGYLTVDALNPLSADLDFSIVYEVDA